MQSRVGLAEQVSCILQVGYFKAKQAFFKFRLVDVPQDDIDFLMRRYFPGQTLRRRPVRQAEYYKQRKEILRLFGYRPWSQAFSRCFPKERLNKSGAMLRRPSSSAN